MIRNISRGTPEKYLNKAAISRLVNTSGRYSLTLARIELINAKGLRHLLANAELKLEGEFEYLQNVDQQAQLLSELEAVEWVSYIEPPPHADSRPDNVLKYLARYLTGGPISDSRIVAADERQVAFLAREGKVMGGQREQIPVTLSTVEFTRRWSLHILPKGYTKARRFGGWSNRRTGEYVERCAMLLESLAASLLPEALSFDPILFEQDIDLAAEANALQVLSVLTAAAADAPDRFDLKAQLA